MVNIITNYECNESCSFCFQKGIKSESMMNIDSFNKIIAWIDQFKFFQEKDRRVVSLIGGEPTLNPNLEKMIFYLKNRYINAIVFTNFVFNKKKIDLFDPKVVKGFVGTYNPPNFYRKGEYEQVEENIIELRKKGFEVKLSYNITKDNLDFRYILDACERHGLKTVRFSTAFPNPKFDNNYLNFEELKEVGSLIDTFVRESVKRGIKPYLDCTIPLCILGSEKNILFFFKHVDMSSQICKSTADINPDLSMYYCMPLAEKVAVKQIYEYEYMKDINDYFERINSESRNNIMTFKECEDCKYRIRNLCQGGCLALKRKFHYTIKNEGGKTYYLKTWGGIGDGLMTIPVFKALKERNPNAEIRVLANKNHASLLVNNPYIDFLSISPDESAIKDADEVIETNYGRLKPSINYQKHAIDIIAEIVGLELKNKDIDIFLTKEEDEKAEKFMSEYEKPIVIQVTSKASSNQNWSIKKWNELVKLMPEFTFIQFGSETEEKIEGTVDLRGTTSIRESIALLKHSTCFVGIVSFLAHATSAVNKKSVVLFGPSNPTTWGYEHNINIYKNLECAPCIDTLGKDKCPNKKECMESITVTEVKQAILEITKSLK